MRDAYTVYRGTREEMQDIAHQLGGPMHDITTVLDMRVPQPGREVEDYGVPAVLLPAVDALRQQRNTCSDPDVAVLDAALLRLLHPWVR